MVTTRPPKTIVKPTALGPVANTDTKLLIYGLFQKGRVLAQDEEVTSGEAQYEDVRDEPTLLVRETAPGYGDRSFDSRESSLGMSRASRESRLAIEWDSMNRHPAPP